MCDPPSSRFVGYDESPGQQEVKFQKKKEECFWNLELLKQSRKMGRKTKFTGLAAMLAPLNAPMPSDSDDDDDDDADNDVRKPTSAPSSTLVAVNSPQKTSEETSSTSSSVPSETKGAHHTIIHQSDTTNCHVNAPVESMEGHSSLASYHPHRQPHHPQHSQSHFHQLQQNTQHQSQHRHHHDFQPPADHHSYYHQQSQQYQQPTTSGHNNGGQTIGRQFDNESSAPPGPSVNRESSQNQSHQYRAGPSQIPQGPPPHYEPTQQLPPLHTIRYEQLPQSAPPHQRAHVLQYPVKVLDVSQAYAPNKNNTGQQGNTLSAASKSSSSSALSQSTTSTQPPPSAPPVMAPRKTPPFQKRQPDAQEQQRVDFEVARNVSQIMSKNGMRASQEHQLPPAPAVPPILRPLAPLAPLPTRQTGYQCPNCNRNLANARNLQRHRQSCGAATIISSSPLPQPSNSHQQQQQHQQLSQVSHQPVQEGSPHLTALLSRPEQKTSPPTPSISAPPIQMTSRSSSSSSVPPSATFQHHNSTGNLMMGYGRNSDSMYSPQHITGNPNVMLSDGYDFKDDPLLFPGPSCDWSRDDSFHSEPMSASHDHIDMMDPLGFHDPLLQQHHPDPFHDPMVNDEIRDSLRDLRGFEDIDIIKDEPEPMEIKTHDSVSNHNTSDLKLEMEAPMQFKSETSMSYKPETPIQYKSETPMQFESEQPPLIRSESASVSSGSQERTIPTSVFICNACQKTVGSDRSLRRHYNTCKAHQAELAIAAAEERAPPPAAPKRKPAGNSRSRAPKKLKDAPEFTASAPQEKNRAIRAVLNKEPVPTTHSHQYHNYSIPMTQLPRPPAVNHAPPNGALPSINASWLQPPNEKPEIFTSPMTSSTPNPYTCQQQTPQQPPQQPPVAQKSSPLEILLNEDDEDGDSRSSSGTVSAKPPGNPAYACGHCSKQLCSASNLKRHRVTCKAAPQSLAASTSTSEPPTPAAPPQPSQLTPLPTPPVDQPAQLQVQQPHPKAQAAQSAPAQHQMQPISLETTATVTYTKTIPHAVPTNTWNSDKMVSPSKQKTSMETDGKPYATVGEMLRAQQLKHQLPGQQQSAVPYQPRYQSQINSRPPRPPNPILNQVQNPPQQVQQNQMQNQMTSQNQNQEQNNQSRPAPPSQHQIVHQQLPRLQSPPIQPTASNNKKGLIEHKNTDLVLITSEPLAEKRAPQQPPQEGTDPRRRASEPQVPPLPPIQLLQRNREPQQTSAYQVQFNGRPLPPMQLPPLQSSMQSQRFQSQMNQNESRFGPQGGHHQMQNNQPPRNQFGAPHHQPVQNQGEITHHNGLGHPRAQQGLGLPQSRQVVQQSFGSRGHSDGNLMQQGQSASHGQSGFGQQQSFQQNKVMHEPAPMTSPYQHQDQTGLQHHQGFSQPYVQMNENQNNLGHQQPASFPPQSHSPQQTRKISEFHQQNNIGNHMESHQVKTTSNLAQFLTSSQPIPHDNQNNQLSGNQLQFDQNFQKPQAQSERQFSPPAQLHQEQNQQTGKQSRSKNMAGKKDRKPKNEEEPEQHRPPGSPLDSIITSVPLSIEVHHHTMKAGKLSEQGLSSLDSAADISPEEISGSNNSNSKKLIPYLCPECDKKYSCRKNVKRHRMAVHKLSLDEIIANPEQPAPPEPEDQPVSAINHGGRRHTVAGMEDVVMPPKATGNKRKASAAVNFSGSGQTGAKKVKEMPPPVIEINLNDTDAEKEPSKPSESTEPQVNRLYNPTPSPQPDIYSTQLQVKLGPFSPPIQSRPNLVPPLLQPCVPPLQHPPANAHPSWTTEHLIAPIPEPLDLTPRSYSSTPSMSQQSNSLSVSRGSEEDSHKMAQIAAELKRCAESNKGYTANDEGKDDDQILFEQLRMDYNGKEQQVVEQPPLEDLGDVMSLIEADSTCYEDAQVDKSISTSSSVGLPSLSSPEERFLPHHAQWPADVRGFHQNLQKPSETAPTIPGEQFQEPLAEPAQKRGSRPPPKRSTEHICTGCRKKLGSDYSLRRHRTGCAEVQKVLNPDYPKPPASKKIALDRKKRQIIAKAEAEVERMEALPPPPFVHEFIDQFEAEREQLNKKQDSTTEEAPNAHITYSTLSSAPPTAPSYDSNSANSMSTTFSPANQEGPQPKKTQERHMCQNSSS